MTIFTIVTHDWRISSASQQHPFSFACYEPHDQLYGSSQYPAARTSPNPPDNVYDFRRLPPMSMSSTARREEGWPTSPFIAHMPFSDEIRSPTTYHAPHYASHHMPHQVPYPFTAMPPDDRNAPFPAAPYNQPPQMYMGPQSSPAGRVGVSRHVVVRRHTHMPAPAEEPVIKKKRKRANAAQLQVLNETYQRTAFPSTEERQTLAVELDMPPRSVQIWYSKVMKVSFRIMTFAIISQVPEQKAVRSPEKSPTPRHCDDICGSGRCASVPQ